MSTATVTSSNPTSSALQANRMASAGDLAGRVGLSTIFLLAGLNKIQGYEGTQGYMASVGVPGELLPLVILVEVLGALLLIFGLFTRITAVALAGFSIVSALLFHADVADPMQFIMFFKNIAMAGGFLVVAAHGAGSWSIDARRKAAR
ncbi:MAG: putative oxidoreductase [Glaciecola sp.]|jgi:putative oxidoreductase|uniref:DoxX family protein n=1 Tax=Congregibacter sp. TaxID=2744308 RepID=UPI0039E47EFD